MTLNIAHNEGRCADYRSSTIRSWVRGPGSTRVAEIRPVSSAERSADQPSSRVFRPLSQSNNAVMGTAAPVICSSRASTDAKRLISLPDSSTASLGDQRSMANTLPMGLTSDSSPRSGSPLSSKPEKKACGGSLCTCRLIRPVQDSFSASFGAERYILRAHPAIKNVAKSGKPKTMLRRAGRLQGRFKSCIRNYSLTRKRLRVSSSVSFSGFSNWPSRQTTRARSR